MRNGARAFDMAWAGMVLVALVLMLRPVATTGDSPGIRRALTPEISDRWRVGQRWRMNANGLAAVTVRPARVADPAGTYRLTLSALSGESIQRSAEVGASDLLARESYVFRFEPIPLSSDVLYQLDVAPAAGSSGRGVALWMTKGDRLREGGLLINDTPRWGSLAFETSTSSAPVLPTLWGRGEATGARPGVLVAVVLWLLGLRLGFRAVAGAGGGAAAPLDLTRFWRPTSSP